MIIILWSSLFKIFCNVLFSKIFTLTFRSSNGRESLDFLLGVLIWSFLDMGIQSISLKTRRFLAYIIVNYARVFYYECDLVHLWMHGLRMILIPVWWPLSPYYGPTMDPFPVALEFETVFPCSRTFWFISDSGRARSIQRPYGTSWIRIKI